MGRKGLAASKAIFVPDAKASAVSIRAALQSKRSEAVRGRSVDRGLWDREFEMRVTAELA